jgi:hypothetical protein
LKGKERRSHIDQQSPTTKYLNERSKVKLVGPLIGVGYKSKCPKCIPGSLTTKRKNELDGEWYLECNYAPMCTYFEIVPKQQGPAPSQRTSSKVQQKYGTEQQRELFCHSFGSRGKARPGKKTFDSDDWASTVFGSGARVVSQDSYTYQDGEFHHD